MTSPAPIRGKGQGAPAVWPSASTACNAESRSTCLCLCTLKPGRHQCQSQFWEDLWSRSLFCPLVLSQRRLLLSQTRQQVCSLSLNASWLNPVRLEVVDSEERCIKWETGGNPGRETNTSKQRLTGEVYFQAPFRDLFQKRVTKHLVCVNQLVISFCQEVEQLVVIEKADPDDGRT